MIREELIELALLGSKSLNENSEVKSIYVDIAEHLLSYGHADSVEEVDQILEGMSIEDAEAILDAPADISEGHKEIAAGTEIDPEGYMALRQMATAREAINRIEAYINNQKDMQLPAWVQAKLAVAAADLDSIGDYFISDTEPSM